VHDEQHNFAHVRCERKVGVDPEPVSTFHGTSDAFFAANDETFDLIFVDGDHTEEQVSRDIANAYVCLAPGGVIVLHDCLPPDAWHQRPVEEFVDGEAWNGHVWRVILREFDASPHKCCIVATDWGCGVIDTAGRQIPMQRQLPAELDYELHFPLLQDYVVSVADFLREDVEVFYHLACIGSWRSVFAEQMRSLRVAGFARVNLSVLGAEAELAAARAVCDDVGLDASIVSADGDLTRFETPALLAVEAYAREHEGYVLYLHSKGVSNPQDGTKARWRRLMMRELVDRWEHCVAELPWYDAIGVNWRDMSPISHFSGNFWYASTRYLRTLADFRSYYDHPRYAIWDAINDKRLGCEFWLGSGSGPPHVLSLVCRNEDMCNSSFWASDHGRV
jgi:hypothetical protein